MDKNILREYESMLLEKADTENRIKDLEQQLQIYDKNYIVQDSVTGGMGGIEHYTIKGFPYPEYSKKKSILLSRKIRLEELKNVDKIIRPAYMPLCPYKEYSKIDDR